jgi:hypothetical protein
MNADERKIEDLNADDAKLSQMLAGLKRVDAPANFEFRLKARIANAKRPERAAAGFLPGFVKYAAPMALIAAVWSLFFLNSGGTGDNAAVQTAGVLPVASKSAEVAAAPLPVEVPTATQDRVAVVVPNASRKGALPQPVDGTGARPNVGPNRSRDSAVKGARVIIAPPSDPNSAPPGDVNSAPETTAPPPRSDKPVSPVEVFSLLGVNADFKDDSGWSVRSVRLNSMAATAGLKNGDVIESIGETQLVKEPVFKGGMKGKVMKVRREGSVVELKLPEQ